jgi:hypothetical protein
MKYRKEWRGHRAAKGRRPKEVVLGTAVAPQTIDGLSSIPCACWECRMSKACLQPHGGRAVHPGRKSRHRNSSIASCVTCVSVGDPTCFVSWMGSAPLPCGGQRRDGWDRAPMRVQEVNLSSHSPPLTASSVSSEPIMRLSCGCAMQEE